MKRISAHVSNTYFIAAKILEVIAVVLTILLVAHGCAALGSLFAGPSLFVVDMMEGLCFALIFCMVGAMILCIVALGWTWVENWVIYNKENLR